MSEPRAVLRITRGQQMALASVLTEYMRLKDHVQSFVDCSTEGGPVTTTPDLLNLVVDAPWEMGKAWEDKARQEIEEAGRL